MDDTINGVIVVNKPQEMTSHDVVAIMRKKLKTKKVGHTGTLDPMATGVLPICVGKATKIVDFLTDSQKAYKCTMKLGAETDTQDQWGKILNQAETDSITDEMYREAILSFVGEVMQVPPMYSALKINGEKLVDLARQGIVVPREARKRFFYYIKDIEINGLEASFVVSCSKGTYIRTLCHDIGLKLGTFGHLTALERVSSSPFALNQAISIETLRSGELEDITKHMISIEESLSCFETLWLPDDVQLVKKIMNGVKIDLSMFNDSADQNAKYFRLYIGDVFYGIAERVEMEIRVKKIMIG